MAAYLAVSGAGLCLAAAGSASAFQQNQYSLLTSIPVTANSDLTACPGASATLAHFDISWTDAGDSLYLLADRTNCSLDVFDAEGNTELFGVGGFAGQQGANNAISGPDGVLTVAHRYAYVGDGNSTVKIVDLLSQSIVDTVSTVRGSETNDNRADEMVWDPRDNLVMVANDSPGGASPLVPYVSFISTVPDNAGHHNVVGQISFPDACDNPTAPTNCGGLEQPVWSNRTGLIYLSVPAIGPSQTTGEIAVINPRSRTIVGAFPVNCQPAGLAIGPHLNAVVGCSDKGQAANNSHKGALIINLKNGNQVAGPFRNLNGVDEVWYNPSTRQYFVAAGSATTTNGNSTTASPVLGVIDASTNQETQAIATAVGDHSVAVDPVRQHVFLPDTASGQVQVYHILGTDVAAK